MANESAVTQDPDAAREFREAYGFSGNAEQIIRSNQMRVSPELRQAEMQIEDTEATSELDKSSAASAVDVEEDQVLAYAVRGKWVVVVYEDETGSVQKTAGPREGSDYEPSAQDKADRASADAEAKVMAASREAREDEEKAVAEARQKAQEEGAEKVAKAQEEASEEQQKAAEDAQKAAEEGDEGSGSSVARAEADSGEAQKQVRRRSGSSSS